LRNFDFGQATIRGNFGSIGTEDPDYVYQKEFFIGCRNPGCDPRLPKYRPFRNGLISETHLDIVPVINRYLDWNTPIGYFDRAQVMNFKFFSAEHAEDGIDKP
jgi:hypothetical protein